MTRVDRTLRKGFVNGESSDLNGKRKQIDLDALEIGYFIIVSLSIPSRLTIELKGFYFTEKPKIEISF